MSQQQVRWLILTGALVLMAVIQVTIAQRQCLWADEIFSLAVATGHSLEHPAASAQPQLGDFVEPDGAVAAGELRRYMTHENPPAGVGRVIRAVLLSDTSPPLYYLLLYGWTRVLGTSDFVLRLFSIVWSLASLPLIAAIAQRIAGGKAVLPACLLFALSPLAIYYSTEGRMYSLLVFLVLATMWLSLYLQNVGASIGVYLLWIITSTAGFLTHYFFFFSWLALVFYLLLQPGKFDRRGLLCCVLLTAVAILPWYYLVPESLSRWRVTKDWLKFSPPGFHRMVGLANEFFQFYSIKSSGLWNAPRWCAIITIGAFVAAVGAMILRLRVDAFRGRYLLIWLWLIAACAAPTGVDLLQHTYLANVPRYAIAALPAAYLLAAVGLASLRRPVRAIALACIFAVWFLPLRSLYQQRARNLEPFRAAARIASTGTDASDLILVHSIPSGVLGIARYSNGPAPIASWVGQLETRRVPVSLTSLIRDRNRISLIKLHEVGQPAPEEDWLRSNSQVLQEKRIGAATIVQFKSKSTATFD
jgi:Dolichyl-phosphate-mannose-protein mannosyltransferase